MTTQNLYDIVTALAVNQPTTAVEKFRAELAARVETQVSDYVSSYQYAPHVEPAPATTAEVTPEPVAPNDRQ